MSEKDGYKPSTPGMLPGGRGPTIIGKKNETENGLLRPTVIKGAPPAPTSQRPKPTVMPSITKPSMQTNIPPLSPSGPSIMPGTVRQGVMVEISELAKRFPGIPETTLVQVKDVLKNTVAETLTTVQCGMWGTSAQRIYAGLVDSSLKLTQGKAVKDGSRHLSRLYELLQEIATSFSEESPQGFAFWKKRKGSNEVFTENQDELNQLRNTLEHLLPDIDIVRIGLEEVSTKLGELPSRIDAEALAGQYLADLFEKSDMQKAQVLADQSMSLTKTIAHIQEGILLRNATIQEINALVVKIRETVLVTLPAWLEKASLVSSRHHTETDIYTLREGIDDIIQNLK